MLLLLIVIVPIITNQLITLVLLEIRRWHINRFLIFTQRYQQHICLIIPTRLLTWTVPPQIILMMINKMFRPYLLLIKLTQYIPTQWCRFQVQECFHLYQILCAILLTQHLCLYPLPDCLYLHYVHVYNFAHVCVVDKWLWYWWVIKILKKLYFLLFWFLYVLNKFIVVLT